MKTNSETIVVSKDIVGREDWSMERGLDLMPYGSSKKIKEGLMKIFGLRSIYGARLRAKRSTMPTIAEYVQIVMLFGECGVKEEDIWGPAVFKKKGGRS